MYTIQKFQNTWQDGNIILKPIFHLANLFALTDKKVGTLPTCSRPIFLPANFNQSRSRILVFASRRANKVATWKIGFRGQKSMLLVLSHPRHFW